MSSPDGFDAFLTDWSSRAASWTVITVVSIFQAHQVREQMDSAGLWPSDGVLLRADRRLAGSAADLRGGDDRDDDGGGGGEATDLGGARCGSVVVTGVAALLNRAGNLVPPAGVDEVTAIFMAPDRPTDVPFVHQVEVTEYGLAPRPLARLASRSVPVDKVIDHLLTEANRYPTVTRAEIEAEFDAYRLVTRFRSATTFVGFETSMSAAERLTAETEQRRLRERDVIRSAAAAAAQPAKDKADRARALDALEMDRLRREAGERQQTEERRLRLKRAEEARGRAEDEYLARKQAEQQRARRAESAGPSQTKPRRSWFTRRSRQPANPYRDTTPISHDADAEGRPNPTSDPTDLSTVDDRSPMAAVAWDEEVLDSVVRRLHLLAEWLWDYRIEPTGEFEITADLLPDRWDDGGLDDAVAALFGHARRWAPGLNVPDQLPRINVINDDEAAGRFVVTAEGRPEIHLRNGIVVDRPALHAVLAHEVCHHLLGASYLDEKDTAENERLTDLATFVCGFGALTNGAFHLRRDDPTGYGRQHLDYLSRQECEIARSWVQATRAQNKLPGMAAAGSVDPSMVPRLSSPRERMTRVAVRRLGGSDVLDRLIGDKALRFPDSPYEELVERVLIDLELDR